MLVKIISLLCVLLLMLSFDVSRWTRISRMERVVYGLLLLPILYLGFLYVTGKPWLNLDDVISFIFAQPAKFIVKSIDPSS